MSPLQLRWCVYGILLSICGCAVMNGVLDRKYLYFPQAMDERTDWAKLSGLPLQSVRLPTSDGEQIHGWWLPHPNPKAVIHWSHGNAGNISHRLDNMALLHSRGYAVFIYDYRGYGLSSGKPTEAGLYRDAAAGYEWLVSEQGVNPRQLILFGRSLGAAVAAYLAEQRPDVAGLILETPFTSIKDMARVHYGGLPVHQLLTARFETDKRIGRIRVPLLVIHGTSDQIVPLELGKRLYTLANEPKTFYQIEGADHNDTYEVAGAEYFERWDAFAAEVLRR